MPFDREALPVRLTYFFLYLVGFGTGKTAKERRILNLWLSNGFLASIFGLTIIFIDFYFVWGSFQMAYTGINVLTALIINIKFFSLLFQRSHYEKVLQITRDSLWGNAQTKDEENVLRQCEKQAMIFVIFFAIFANSTSFLYIIEAILLNVGNNITDVTERRFPFKIWLDLPVYETPNFHIFFLLQSGMACYAGILYCCYDNYLVLVNIFIAGQFTILKYRLELLYNRKIVESIMNKDSDRGRLNEDFKVAAREFKDCVKQHQFLIWIVGEIESLYSLINLTSVLIYSLIICLTGYQLIMPGNVLIRRLKFTVYIGGCLTQLLSFSYTCHNLSLASVDVCQGPYNSKWYKRSNSERSRSLTRDFVVMIMRAQRPCHLTGAGFFPVTLDTLKSVLTTAFSYLTLIRQRSMVGVD
ncbi:odorant receptor Or2 [Diachasma alloeum]|uniref:Odorant receptor n=1 Tax=Diachasma alloeum TaxID=454923 RepID=A0A4E0RM92_9HYME|nr:odorant receptor Or2 [Diachasma alloeum]THK32858.1 odorant receptor 79 [Diachasma alloeum]